MNNQRRYRGRQPLSLRPHDVCVGLQLLLTPEVGFRELAAAVGLSLGEAHKSTGRLAAARLLMPHRRAMNARNFLEFLLHGVPYAFPGEVGSDTRGVPTAHSGPALRDRIASDETMVWPSLEGDGRGFSLVPLCPEAPSLAAKNPALYRWLTLVDALRVGRSRERRLAAELLRAEIDSTLTRTGSDA